jgi:hypothetical protein
MKVNESMMDRIIRGVLGLALLGFVFSGGVTSTLGTVFLVIGFILLATGVIGFCPLYHLLKVETKH